MRRCCLLLFIALTGFAASAQQEKFRVIGYLRVQNIADGQAAHVDYSRVTHINIAFINPDSLGDFASLPGLKDFADSLHKRKIKILASIGGGLAPVYYSDLMAGDKRPALVKKLAQLTDQYDLDGIDVDLEGTRIDTNYESFIIQLSASLKAKNKLLTAAVATTYKKRYTDKALACFDFISIMSYDKTGPWNLKKPGPHAPYKMAAKDVKYWTREKGVAKEKLNVGIPFYGYGFGPDAPESMSFGKIIGTYPGSENNDEVDLPGGGAIYYNGAPTIKKKTQLALKHAGGIMIWQLLQDGRDSQSLLKLVNDTIISGL